MAISKFFNTDKFNLQQIVTPCIGTKTSLLVFRLSSLVILFYGFLVSIYNCHYNYRTDDLRLYLPYFTNQVFICILLYFSVSGKQTNKQTNNSSSFIIIVIIFLIL